MAISTYKTYLMHKASGDTFSKLIDVKDIPDLGSAPEMLQTTTLSDAAHTYIPGIQDVSGLEFTCNYTSADFTTLKALEGTEAEYAVYFGSESGSDGKFTFKGYLSVYVNGGGVNEVVEMTITIAPTTVITFSAS